MLLLPAQVYLSNHHPVHFTVDLLCCLLALQSVCVCGGGQQRRGRNNVITNYTIMSKRTNKCSNNITAYQYLGMSSFSLRAHLILGFSTHPY